MSIYKITPDTNHSGDPGRDAFYVPFEKATILKIAFWKPDPIPEHLSNHLYFDANFDIICSYDFPYLDVSLPVMSKKMVNVLTSVGNIDWNLFPVTMLQDTYLLPKFDNERNLLPNVPVDNSFSVVQFNTYCSCFDREAAKFITYEGLDTMTIKDLVLKEPNTGFPPIFRIKEQISSLFISEATKVSFESNNIQGVVYQKVKTTSPNS